MMRKPSASLSILGLGKGIAGNVYGFGGWTYRPGIANGGGGGCPRCGPVCCIEYIMIAEYTGLYRTVEEERVRTAGSCLLLRTWPYWSYYAPVRPMPMVRPIRTTLYLAMERLVLPMVISARLEAKVLTILLSWLTVCERLKSSTHPPKV